jgi:hypothetical protein
LESHFRIDQSQRRHHTEPVDRRNEPQHKTTQTLSWHLPSKPHASNPRNPQTQKFSGT